MFKPYFKKSDTDLPGQIAPRNVDGTFYPMEVASLYGFPTGDGTGQRIGIIELGGGYRINDIQIYFQNLGIKTSPKITSVSIDNAVNNPYDQSGANFEVVLDVEIISSLVPQASVFVYFAPNSYDGFYHAIEAAINQSCKVISISWGAPEASWPSDQLTRFNSLLRRASETGCTVCVAAGDCGSSDGISGVNVDFPSSSPFVLACGGTTLVKNGSTIRTEVVWNDNPTNSATGGGCSMVFDKPDYQSLLPIAFRGVPDVSGNADPNTGYRIFMSGSFYIVGGTSAVSPLWAALITRINQRIGRSIGLINDAIYAAGSNNTNVCRDIVSGNNDAFTAGVGWDRCSGYGSPNGASLLAYLTRPPIMIVADFSITVISAKLPFQIRVLDSSTGGAKKWLWDFGDKTATTVSQNPIHIYTKVGAYNIRLIVTDSNGHTATVSRYINVTK